MRMAINILFWLCFLFLIGFLNYVPTEVEKLEEVKIRAELCQSYGKQEYCGEKE